MIEYQTAQLGAFKDLDLRRSLRAAGTRQIIVIANRQPFSHHYDDSGRITVKRAHSGVVHAVEPLVAACSGVWVAHGGGSADRATVDECDGVEVPIADPAYRLRRVWMSEEEHSGFYDGFANEGLWPLCHRAFVKPVFRAADFASYQAVNHRFVEAACEEAVDDGPVVLVQDYHFALAPQLIRKRLRRSIIATFWHIPWPHWRELEVCPWRRELLQGMLGSDLLGFQTATDCAEFAASVEHFLDARVDRREGLVQYGRRRVLVRHYPASIEWPSPWEMCSPPPDVCRRELQQALGLRPHVQIGVSLDRMDYTKGLEEKFAALERMFERHPEFRESFAFVQLAQPTRGRLPAYRDLRARLTLAADRINARFGTGEHQPLTLLEGDHDPRDVFRYLRGADLCFVASLQDGMNLVSKEFVSARNDARGVLVLSRFAGAARELYHALLVNPWDINGTADVLARALRMHPREQRRRMRKMRAVVARRSAYQWAEEILRDLIRFRQPADEPVAAAHRVLPITTRRPVRVIDFRGRRVHARS